MLVGHPVSLLCLIILVRVILLSVLNSLCSLVPDVVNPSYMILCFTCLFIILVEPQNHFVK